MKHLLTLLLFISTSVMGASFDCNKASTKHEKFICENKDLNLADEKMGEAYQGAKTRFPMFKDFIKKGQIRFISEGYSIWDGKKYIKQPYNKCDELTSCLELVNSRIQILEANPLRGLEYEENFKKTLFSSIPKKNVYLGMTKNKQKKDLNYHLNEVLQAPTLNVNNKILIYDGFRQHSAEEKGFIWFDTVSAKKIYVIRAFFYNDDKYIRDGMFLIFTKDFIGNEIPKEFYVDFNNWKDSNKLSKKILEKFIN